MKSLLILTLINLVILNPIIIKSRCDQDPNTICESNGRKKFVATSLNLQKLMSILKNNNVPNAYVYGWNDHRGLYVVHQNGNVAPYDKYTNVSDYAFCEGICPCPEDNIVSSHSKQMDSESWYDHVSRCKPHLPWFSDTDNYHKEFNVNSKLHYPHNHPHDYKFITNQQTCHIYDDKHCKIPLERHHYKKYDQISPHHHSQQDCSYNTFTQMPSYSHCRPENKPCPFFQKIKSEKCKIKECYGDSLFSDKLNKNNKSFTIRYINDCTNQIITKDEINATKTKVYNINSPKSCSKYNIPPILHNFKLLCHVKHILECKFKSKICLYVTDNNSLYVYFDGCLYRVCFMDGVNDMRFYTKIVNKDKVHELSDEGLYRIEF